MTLLKLSEPQRPFLHFTPPKMWLNDPNGMVFYKDEYHLFYQYHPDSTVWGPMHWGHAVTQDLVNWTHLPIALYPDELGYIYSGSAVIDWHNTAGFGKEAMVAFYTYHDPDTLNQSQALAYSLDNGRSWTKHCGNPIIPSPANTTDFRDPKVFWYGAVENGHWVMIIAAGSAILFYTSDDMVNWKPSSSFGQGHGSRDGIWETPDIFQLSIENEPDPCWLLTVGVSNGAPAGGSGMQYFVGHFDGKSFTNLNDKEVVLWADYGGDFYAAQSWSDVPNGRRLLLAWMNNWRYAAEIPTSTWRGAMTLPREVTLTQSAAGIRMRQQPVQELTMLRQEETYWEEVDLLPEVLFMPQLDGELFEIVATFEFLVQAEQFGIELVSGIEPFMTLGYSPKSKRVFANRMMSETAVFHEGFAATHTAGYEPMGNSITLRLFIDRSTLELFVDDGIITFSERVFPAEGTLTIAFFSEQEPTLLKRLQIFPLRRADFYLDRVEDK